MTERIDWRAKQPSRVALIASRKIRGIEDLETLHNQGHYMIEHLEERGVENGSARRSSLKEGEIN